jgi:hypothetical protein
MPLEFPNLSTLSSKLRTLKMTSQKNLSACCGFQNLHLRLKLKEISNCVWKGNTKKNVDIQWYKFSEQTDCIFLRKSPPRDDQSLKLKWMEFERLPLAVHANQPRILPENLRFKSYRYQRLQQVIAENKEYCHKFCCEFLLKMTKFLEPNLTSAMLPLSTYREILIDIT